MFSSASSLLGSHTQPEAFGGADPGHESKSGVGVHPQKPVTRMGSPWDCRGRVVSGRGLVDRGSKRGSGMRPGFAGNGPVVDPALRGRRPAPQLICKNPGIRSTTLGIRLEAQRIRVAPAGVPVETSTIPRLYLRPVRTGEEATGPVVRRETLLGAGRGVLGVKVSASA